MKLSESLRRRLTLFMYVIGVPAVLLAAMAIAYYLGSQAR